MTDLSPAAQKAVDLFASALNRSDRANKTLEAAQIEANDASAELTWVAAHPALNGLDLSAIAAEIRNGASAEPGRHAEPDAKPAETEQKPKRKRRTKAEIEADKAREEAEKNGTVPGSEGEDAPEQTFTSTPEGDTAETSNEDDTFSEATPAEPVAAPQPAAVASPFPTQPPAPQPSPGSVFNPFAERA